MAEAQKAESKEKRAQQVATGDRAILPEGAKTIPVYVMGKRYEVPETLTIMKAMEYAGFNSCGVVAAVVGSAVPAAPSIASRGTIASTSPWPARP